MFQENEKEWILEAINHLKHRKARPDLSRISLRMKRKHQMSFAQTRKLLDLLIESGIVVKAVYKNNTSYRDVSKWKKGRLGGQIMNSHRMLKRFIRAIEAKEKEKGTGVSAKDIEDYLASQGEEKCFLAGAALKDALENEIGNGYLTKVAIGTQVVHYKVNVDNVKHVSQILDLEAEDMNERDNSDINEDSNIECPDIGHLLANVQRAIYETQHQEGYGSSLLDIKGYLLIKGIHFTDDTFLSDFLESSTSKGSLKKIIEDNVIRYAVSDGASSFVRIVPSECTNGLKDFDDLKVRENCDASRDSTSCSALFHTETSTTTTIEEGRRSASGVPLRPPSKRRRIMKDHGPDFEIEMPTKMKPKTIEGKEPSFPTPSASPIPEIASDQSFKIEVKKKRGRPKKVKSPSLDEPMDPDRQDDENSKQDAPSEISFKGDEDDVSLAPEYPDITAWTSQQVAEYFQERGYTEEATAMLENELDGAALGLLRRSDIVGPPLGGILKIKKLGIALKLFRDIRDLLYYGNADNYVDPYEECPFLKS